MSTVTIPCPACGSELKLRDRSLLGKRGKCPKCSHRFVLQEPARDEVELELVDDAAAEVPVGREAHWVDEQSGADTAAAAAPMGTAVLEELSAKDGGVSRLKELRRKRRKRTWPGLAVGFLVASAAGAALWQLWPRMMASKPVAVASAVPVASAPVNPDEDDVAPAGEYAAAYADPTASEKAVTLKWMPVGAKMIFHLRPHDLWQPGGQAEEFRYSLGPLGVWLEQTLTDICYRPPLAIEEVTICLIPGARGTMPEFAAAVTLLEEAKRSEMLLEFGGERIDDYGHPVYLTGDRAFIIEDTRRFVTGPASMAAEMVEAAGGYSPTSTAIEELLPVTDRARQFTAVFDIVEARLNAELLIPDAVRPLFEQFMDWLNEDTEAVVWSLHLSGDKFYSEMLLRNPAMIRPAAFRQAVQTRLDALPEEVLTTVKYMQPTERGKRRIIGRYPAMVQATVMATQVENGIGNIRVVTALPERAAPNLAVGTLLTWDQSTRTDFSDAAPPEPQKPTKQVPAKIADRLQLKIDVDFRRTPLQEAFAFIAEEIATPIEIDGDALKLSGYTKNMPMTFAKTQEPAIASVKEFLTKFDQLAIVVDDEKKTILLTTIPVAEKEGLTVFPVN